MGANKLIPVALLSILASVSPIQNIAFAKSNIPKEKSSCKTFGQLYKKLQCVSVSGKNIWQEITLTGGSKKYPSELTECFRENTLVLGYLKSKELGQLECVWDVGKIGQLGHWKSNEWTYSKAINDPSRSIVANAWKSIVSLPNSSKNFNIIYHIEPGVNKDVVEIYKKRQDLFLKYFGDYFDNTLPFHTVISNSWAYVLAENLKIDDAIPGYSKWFSESHNKKYWELVKSKSSAGYPYASKRDVCSYLIDSNFQNPCPKLDGYVTGILLYPGYKLKGEEVEMPAHEAFEILQGELYKNYLSWPAWLRSGSAAFIGSTIATDTEILNVKGGVLNPIPNIPSGRLNYDLAKAEDINSDERYTFGYYANAYLIGNGGITTYLNFLKEASTDQNWEQALFKIYGMNKKGFYSEFNKFIGDYSATN